MAPGTLNVVLPKEYIVHQDTALAAHEYFTGEVLKLQRCRAFGFRMWIMRPIGIYQLQSAQRTGLGTGLMPQLASRLADLGLHSLIVRVLADTPARRFSMQMGGTLVAEGVHTVDGQPYPERTYGYADLATLAREDSVHQAFAAVGA